MTVSEWKQAQERYARAEKRWTREDRIRGYRPVKKAKQESWIDHALFLGLTGLAIFALLLLG